MLCRLIGQLNNIIKISNKFQHLDSKTKITDDDVKALNSWAKIYVAKLGESQADRKKRGRMVIVKSERGMDKIMGKMAALPTDRKGLTKDAKRVTKHKEIQLENDEFLAMLDSGSFLHAVNADEVLPLHKINPPGPRERRQKAETACGGILEILGTVDVDAEVDGHKVGVGLNHMNVNSPILSVRRLVKDGHEVYIGKVVALSDIWRLAGG